jgi:hypothetical protein
MAAENIDFSTLAYPETNWLDYMSTAANPGVYIAWERRSTSTIAFYQILRGPTLDGTFSTLVTIPFPAFDYVDSTGNPSHFYKIREIGPDGTVLTTTEAITGSEMLLKASLIYQIKTLMEVHVESEEGIFDVFNRSSCRFVHKYWNAYPRAEIRISGYSSDGNVDPMIHLDGVNAIYKTINGTENNYPNGITAYPDYKGKLFFKNAAGSIASLESYDTVYASYWTKMFTYSELNNALYMALQAINSQPGTTKYLNVGNAPFYYDAALITGACYYLLRSLVVQLKNREFKLLLADPENNDIFSQLKDDARLYKEDFDKFLEKIPLARYPTTKTIVTPEYMLPGGRSRFFRALFKGMGG